PVVASPRRHGRTQLGELVSLDPGLGPRADFQRRKRYPYFYLSLVFPCVGPPGRPHVATVGFASKFWSERTPGEAQGGSGIGSFGSPQIWGCRGPKPPCSDQGKATDPGGPASPSLGLLPRGRPGAVDRRLHGMRSWSPTGRPPATGHASFSRQPRGWRPRAARPAIGRCRGGHLRWDSGERPYRWSICVLKTPDGGYGTGWLLRFRRECQFDARLFVTNQRLDYTIVGLVDADGLVPLEIGDAGPGDIVTIAGHANGWPRVVSTSKVKEVDEHYLYYGANTLDGSSGSPVLVLREGGACVVAGLHQGRSAEAGANYGLRLGPALADAVRRARRASSQAADGAPAAAGHGGGDALCSSAGATGHHPDVHIVRRRG
ncbi:unnamed protein product, partial [Prorocentrum cordatum]